jgi:hypothetical protein
MQLAGLAERRSDSQQVGLALLELSGPDAAHLSEGHGNRKRPE